MKPLSDRQILADYNQYSPARRILPLMMLQTLFNYFFRSIHFGVKAVYTWWGMGIQTYGWFVVFASGVYTFFFWYWGMSFALADVEGFITESQTMTLEEFAGWHTIFVIIVGVYRRFAEWDIASQLKPSYKPLSLGKGFFEWVGDRRIGEETIIERLRGNADPIEFKTNWHLYTDSIALFVIGGFIALVLEDRIGLGLMFYIWIGAIGIYLQKNNYRKQLIKAVILQRANEQWAQDMLNQANEFDYENRGRKGGKKNTKPTTVSCVPPPVRKT